MRNKRNSAKYSHSLNNNLKYFAGHSGSFLFCVFFSFFWKIIKIYMDCVVKF